MTHSIELTHAKIPQLADRRVVILGGTGAVGEGVVRAWLKAGAEVIVPSRAESKVVQFTAAAHDLSEFAKLSFAVGDYTSFSGAESMAERITSTYGPVTDVIASIGGWWQRSPLWGVSEADWQKYFVDLITAHVAQVRAWIPRLATLGSFQLILGGSATTPVPGASIINMEQAALLMMRQVLAAEVGTERRITSVVLGPVITRQRQHFDPDWVSADEVGVVTAGIGARSQVRHVDFQLRNKADITKALTLLEILPTTEGNAIGAQE